MLKFDDKFGKFSMALRKLAGLLYDDFVNKFKLLLNKDLECFKKLFLKSTQNRMPSFINSTKSIINRFKKK